MLTFVVAALGTALVIIGYKIMVDFTRLNSALAALGASVASVAAAIRNPQVDNNSQAVVDEIAGRLENVAQGLEGLAAEETALDTAEQIDAEPPASEPIEDTGTLEADGGAETVDAGAVEAGAGDGEPAGGEGTESAGVDDGTASAGNDGTASSESGSADEEDDGALV